MDAKIFYTHLSKILESKKLAESVFCELAGLSSSYISSMKSRGRLPAWDKLDKICEALGMTYSQFFEGLEENDEFTALCAAKIKRLTENMSREDKIFLNRYTDYLTPEAFASDVSRLRKTIRDLKE